MLGLVIVESVLLLHTRKRIYLRTNSNVSCTNWQLRLPPPCQFLYPVALPFTSLLLVLRAVALYKNNKYVTAFFALSWLAFLASCITIPMGAVGMQIGNTPFCIEMWASNFTRYAIIGTVSPVIHDTLIFVATTWDFMGNVYMDVNLKNAFNVMVLGRHLHAFSKSFLRDGQLYFL